MTVILKKKKSSEKMGRRGVRTRNAHKQKRSGGRFTKKEIEEQGVEEELEMGAQEIEEMSAQELEEIEVRFSAALKLKEVDKLPKSPYNLGGSKRDQERKKHEAKELAKAAEGCVKITSFVSLRNAKEKEKEKEVVERPAKKMKMGEAREKLAENNFVSKSDSGNIHERLRFLSLDQYFGNLEEGQAKVEASLEVADIDPLDSYQVIFSQSMAIRPCL